MRALINAFIIHLTLNLLVFLKGWHVFEGKKAARIILSILFVSELLFYATGFFLYRHLPEPLVQLIRVTGTSWMLFLLYSGGLWLIIDLVTLIFLRQLHRPLTSMRNGPPRRKRLLFLLPVIAVALIMAHGRYRFIHPVVEQVPVTLHKKAGDHDSLRIVVAGDMHLGWMIDRNHTRRFVDLIMAQQADMILFVGDIFDSQIEPILQQGMDQELRRLTAPLGIFTCTGNHEYRYDSEEKISLLNDVGISVLRDSAVLIDSAFYLVGREDKVIAHRKQTAELLANSGLDHTKPVILLNHTPDNLDEEADAGIDIALYGHTHHGQAFPGNLITEWIFEVAHGYKKKGDTHVYVTSGLGLVGPQYRVGTQSEIALLRVRFE
ncbi:MAG TPA: metallophosphoesterase [Proteiniphilum sp.]|nr:metallophosphoesterase [Proteiniphilum sp.]HPD86156.1 metallophosphoesterase [Proteiniphilum sp.]HPJ49598.1 metallophosphoesterase [Proteiniphilum sp.]HPR19913.1 metallophosphoesterase [Proteiniphilum sp.]